MKYFAKVKYLGTNFSGFQVQPSCRTVQGELCRALSATFGLDVMVTGCSRTDAGVHANEFCITAECEGATIPPEKLPLAVSRYMPEDLALYFAKECSQSFHPRYDAKSKEYLYRIKNAAVYDPFEFGRAWFIPRAIDDFDIQNMRSAAEYLIGTHDFAAFMSEGSDVISTVRTIYYLNIEKHEDLIEIRICADGFLYNMVRIIVGTLIEVAHGRLIPSGIANVLNSKERSRAGMTAPACGLYLNKVNY